MELNTLEKLYQDNRSDYFESWKKLLTFQSISADPEYQEQCLACASWLKDHLDRAGFAAELWSTESKPVVFAEKLGQPGAPTLLFYGHYDVQPVDPLNEWTSAPFEPAIRGNRLYARGAQDNKGQLMYAVSALSALNKVNQLPCNIKIIIEGEEECGSAALAKNLANWQNRLSADILLVCDTGTTAPNLGTITMGLRGVCSMMVTVKGPSSDLHSGCFGGAAPNPATAIARMIATLHDETGKIAVPGFYEGAEEPTTETLQLAQSIPFDPQQFFKETGVLPTGGERDLPLEVRRGLRPTIEINGLHSGYGGPGNKTIIPRDAISKLSVRLVPGQTSTKALALIREHLSKQLPDGLRVEFSEEELAGDGGALSLSASTNLVKLATQALHDTGLDRVNYLWEGASVPVVAGLAKAAQAAPLLVGFALAEDRIHAPDESFDLDQFKRGFLFVGLLANRLVDKSQI